MPVKMDIEGVDAVMERRAAFFSMKTPSEGTYFNSLRFSRGGVGILPIGELSKSKKNEFETSIAESISDLGSYGRKQKRITYCASALPRVRKDQVCTTLRAAVWNLFPSSPGWVTFSPRIDGSDKSMREEINYFIVTSFSNAEIK